MSNFDRFRKTFENLTSSFTSEVSSSQDQTEQSKSEYTSDKSYYDHPSPYLNYPTSKSDLNSFDQGEIDLKKYISNLTQIQESLYAESELLKLEKKSLTNDNLHLRSRIQELEKQLDSLSEKLQKRDKDLNKLQFEKELLQKLEEDSKRLIEDLKKNCDLLLKENNEYKKSLELFKSEKRELLKTFILKKPESQTFKPRPEFALTLDHTSPDTERLKKLKNIPLTSTVISSASRKEENCGIKSNTGKFCMRTLDLTDKRSGSESPERKPGLTDRHEDYKQLLVEVKHLLSAKSSFEIREKILKLKECTVKLRKTQKFISKLSNMLLQISPIGSFEREPSTRQIWKWLTRLLEEYMKIKQSVSGESFNKLAALLGTFHLEEMVDKVVALQNLHRGRNSLRGINCS